MGASDPGGLRIRQGLQAVVAVGASLAIPLHRSIVVAFAVFVVVAVTAVWVRRFGPRWFAYGLLAWQAYFFSLFLHPPVVALPVVLLGIVVAAVWVTVLLLTVLWDDPAARLRRTVTSLPRPPTDEPEQEDVAAAVRRLFDEDGDDRWPALNRLVLRLADAMALLTGRARSG